MRRDATQSRVSIEDAEWENPANWHGGFLNLYFSRRDSRPFVPKRGTVVGDSTMGALSRPSCSH